MKALLNKRRLAAWMTVPALLASGIVMGSAVSASATNPTVQGFESCVNGQRVLDWKVGGDPAYPNETATIKTQSLGTTNTDGTGGPNSLVNKTVKNTSSVTGRQTGIIAVGTSYTLTVKVQWTNHSQGDLVTQSGTFKTSNTPCTQTATPAAYTVTPPTCTTNGSLSIPAQLAGVIVKVSGSTVNPPFTISSPGSYPVAYSAAPGYVLSNNPSGTAVVGAQFPIGSCTQPPPHSCPPGTTWVDSDGDGVVDQGECLQPVRVKGSVKKLDKCASNNFLYVKKAKGLHYVVNGKTLREGVWLKVKGSVVKVRFVVDSSHYLLFGPKLTYIRFPKSGHCGPPPVVPPPAGS